MTPDQAITRLTELHSGATGAMRRALDRFVRTGTPPTDEERAAFCYPELRATWTRPPHGP